jgi:hypothetical protein
MFYLSSQTEIKQQLDLTFLHHEFEDDFTATKGFKGGALES